ncbi:hypothetical protein [Thalassotalea sp. PS06]|uniref:hypothetical protein n=1 Tax=Thalassotalea sp. PS06 TaxID=2594005 RepID=UPI00163D704B|nr:hypothetical protein [Thalassotalea sp. PS06]
MRLSIEQRRFRVYLYLDEFVGDLIIYDADDGRRVYHYRGVAEQERNIKVGCRQ